MKLSVKNLNKPSHPRLKRIADYLLYTVLPALNGMFLYIESKEIITPEIAMYGVAITSFLIPCFKGLTKFTADENVYTGKL